MGCCCDGTRGAGPGVAVVHGDGIPLVLHCHPGNRGKLTGELLGGIFKNRNRLGGSLIAVMDAVWPHHLEAMATGVPQPGNAHPGLHVGQVATGEHRNRIPRCQLPQRLLCAGHRDGRGGVVDDLRQRAVEVEEERRPTRCQHAGDLAEGQQGVGQPRHRPIDGAQGDLGQIADNRVGRRQPIR